MPLKPVPPPKIRPRSAPRSQSRASRPPGQGYQGGRSHLSHHQNNHKNEKDLKEIFNSSLKLKNLTEADKKNTIKRLFQDNEEEIVVDVGSESLSNIPNKPNTHQNHHNLEPLPASRNDDPQYNTRDRRITGSKASGGGNGGGLKPLIVVPSIGGIGGLRHLNGDNRIINNSKKLQQPSQPQSQTDRTHWQSKPKNPKKNSKNQHNNPITPPRNTGGANNNVRNKPNNLSIDLNAGNPNNPNNPTIRPLITLQ